MDKVPVRAGLDIAKRVFALHAVNSAGETVLRKKINRKDVTSVIALMPRCVIGIESCGGSHFWARELKRLGHEVRLIAVK